MTKTIRMHQIQAAAEKLFGPKLSELNKKVGGLADRVRMLERNRGVIPIAEAETVEKGAVLKKKKELKDASKSSG